MGVYAIAPVYLIVSFLPPWFGILIPVLGLIGAIVYFWPHWFDRANPAGAGRRLLKRLGTVACAIPAGALASFLIVLALPGFIDWSSDQHRMALERRGVAEVEIQRQLATHRPTPSHFLVDGALMVAMPGLIASLVTTAAGAILLRQRPTRP
jgi:hypothetical protein